MTHDPWIVFFVVTGMLTVIRFMMPIYEAIWFALVTTSMVMLGAGWASLKPKNWYSELEYFCRKMTSRLWGADSYCVSQEMDGWVFEPPFKIYRHKKDDTP